MADALYPTLEALSDAVQEFPNLDAAYVAKMLHKLPVRPVIDRVPWLVTRLTGKVILDVGCVGPLHEALLKVCTRAYGLDHVPASYPDYRQCDLERDELPVYPDVQVVLLGEVLEHVTSPGVLLWQVQTHYPGCEVLISVPNCYSLAGRQWMLRGFENQNIDHTMQFSYQTLHTLLAKCGYVVQEWYWTGPGEPGFSEGLLAVCAPSQTQSLPPIPTPSVDDLRSVLLPASGIPKKGWCPGEHVWGTSPTCLWCAPSQHPCP